jgi:hypothetical protein
MLSVTLPRKPVPPIKNIFRPLNISVGESLFVMIQNLALSFGEGRYTHASGVLLIQHSGGVRTTL